MEAKRLYERMRRALEALKEIHGERGSTSRIYRLGGEKWPVTMETALGAVEHRGLSKKAVTALQREIGPAFPQVEEVLYFVPGEGDPLPQRGLIVRLPSKNERINVEVWEDGTFRIVSEDFVPGHRGIRGRAHLSGVEAGDPEAEKLLREHFDEIREEVIKKFNRGKGLPYNFEVTYGAARGLEKPFSLRPPERGARIVVEYISPREPAEKVEEILRNLSEIRKKLLEAHEKLKNRSRR
ncbi:TPA: hypothetical protein EYP13_04310 [Candidatus Micrarchaeota archaeon]|nr:hypothetical protein [Candidatus Micrarchaeota archaeon]